MAGVPYSLPAAAPDPGETSGDVPARSHLDDLAARLAVHEEVYGVPLDGFGGADDDAKLKAAMSYAAAQSRPPAIVLANRTHTFKGGPYRYYDGFRLVGSLGTIEREFAGNGPQCIATVGGSALFAVPSGGVKNMFVTGVQFRAASGGVHFQTPVTDFAGGPIMQDADFRGMAWVGFKTVMHARHMRCGIERVYINNGTDTQLKLAGSDNYYFVEGKSYMSAHDLTAAMFYLWFPHMSRTQVGPLYITPEVATGVRVDGSYGNLVFTGTLFDCTGRNASTACQGSAVLITGGTGMVFRDCWFFNNAVRPAATGRRPVDRGQVFVRGSAAEILFDGCQFNGGAAQTMFTPSGTPAIYAATGVSGVKVSNPVAPNKGAKLLQQQSAGIIAKYGADDWTLKVA